MHALRSHLAPSRPVSNFCHCYWPVPLFCVPLQVSEVIVVGVISHPSLALSR